MAETMKALVKREAGEGHLDGTGAEARPGSNEVLIKLEKTAICGTDLHIYKWDEWSQRVIKPGPGDRPRVRRRIVELGQGVTATRSATASPPKATSSAATAATAAPAASTCARTRSASA
jgi:threonine 3-dehydrogenase